MEERQIVIEQRLRSGGVTATIGAIAFVFILVSTFLESGSSSSFPVWGLLLELVVLIALVLVILLFTRVVARVVQTDFGRGLEIVYGPGGVVRQVFEPAEVEGTYARNL